MCGLNFTRSKLCVPTKNSIKLLGMCALCGTYPCLVSVSDFTEFSDFFKNCHNSIKLCWNKSKKMPRLNNDKQNQAIGMLNSGTSATVVSRHFGYTRKTIERLWRRFVSQEKFLTFLKVVRHVWPLLPMIAISFFSTYMQPIRAYWPYFGQILTRRHRTARRDGCHRHLHFRRADWDLVLFCDECRFNLSHADGCERVYRRLGEHFADVCVIDLDHFGCGSLLVCSGIIYSVVLTACATISERALHKMADTWDTDTFHLIFSLFLLVDTPPNEFKPVLFCNCVLQN